VVTALPRVVVADDQAENGLIVAAALKGEFEVVQVASGAEVLNQAAAGDLDLVLLDVMMPGMDGFEICRRLKADPLTAAIPVIFVTARDDSADEAYGFELGAVDYITKPIRPSIVRARVRAHVELKRTRDLLEQLASIDPLTGVANRRHFDQALEEEWRRSVRSDRWLSLALVDVDHFKRFNDSHGHLAGDERLRAIASSLAQSARRAGDLVARYGVPAADRAAKDALAIADGLLYQAKAAGRDRALHVDLSTGLKTVITGRASPEEGSRHPAGDRRDR
jgi:PleD family two-component response regulator